MTHVPPCSTLSPTSPAPQARLSTQASRVAPLVLAKKEAQRELEESESYGGPFALQPSRHEILTNKLHLINER